MRTKLKQVGTKARHTYTAEYGSVGYKKSGIHYLPTLLLVNVKLNGQIITDHLWLNYTKGFSQLGMLQPGEVIVFDGRVKQYQKGYYTDRRQRDYKLERPTKIHLLHPKTLQKLPDAIKQKNELVGYIMKTNKQFYLSHNRPYDEWYVDLYEKWQSQSFNH